MTKYKEFNEYQDENEYEYDGEYDWSSRITHVIVCHYSARPKYGAKGLEIGKPCSSCEEAVGNKVAQLLGAEDFSKRPGKCVPEYGRVLCMSTKSKLPKVY